MLPSQNRLKRRQDFANVYSKGDRFNGQYVSLRVYITDQATAFSQIGVVVSKKFSKKAVARNRIKRQLRAIFRQVLSQLKQGLQIVVTVFPLPNSPSYEQLGEDLTKLLIKAQVLHGDK